MPPPPLDQTEVLNRFTFHPATPLTGPQHDAVREVCRVTAVALISLVPPGRHQMLALTALQEAMMWANAGVACDQPPVPAEPVGA